MTSADLDNSRYVFDTADSTDGKNIFSGEEIKTAPVHEKKGLRKKTKFRLSVFYLSASAVFAEFFAHLFIFGFSISRGIIYIPFLALSFGMLITYFMSFFKKKARRIIMTVLLAAMAVLFSFHLVYYRIFKSFFSFHAITLGGDAITDFLPQTLKGIFVCLPQIIIMFVPLVVFRFFCKKFFKLPAKHQPVHAFSLAVAIIFFITSTLFILPVKENRAAISQMSLDPTKSFSYYGINAGTTLDLFQSIFGFANEDVDNPYDNGDEEDDPEVVVYEENKLNIDFDALIEHAPNGNIRGMHEYFKSIPASYKNKYTGMFEGKNLIFLTLEGFSSKVIDPELTPTLYKMYHEGFYFEKFYDSPWGGSTATGEYSNMTGNFYNTADCLKKSANNLQYSSLGNLFRNSGYATYAYHNHTYTYYGRDRSHPNFGYTYKGVGNGVVLTKKTWPESDLELAQVTVNDYINSDVPFHAYYMTVSGHANYSWTANAMSKYHQSEIPENSPYSENVKAYIACNLEVEYMLNELIARLEEAGKLDDTVFAMCCDHYPYALAESELSELYGLDANGITNNYELYRNSFILWSSSMTEPVNVTTPCSSYDMVPTLANLFGLDFDSRVITGTDILSTRENIVIINTLGSGGSWNWITEQGRYSTVTKTFTPSETCTLTEDEIKDYVKVTTQKVTAMRKYSLDILNHNYYKYVFNTDGTPLYTLPAEDTAE